MAASRLLLEDALAVIVGRLIVGLTVLENVGTVREKVIGCESVLIVSILAIR
jgi:hypothetical protein